MPKTTAFLVRELEERHEEALDLAQASELTQVFSLSRRFYVYEAAYLLAFSAWESFLERSFLRFMCGYGNSHGQPQLVLPGHANSLAVAHQRLLNLGGRPQQYLLWHNPIYVIQRSSGVFRTGPHETVVQTVFGDISDFAAIRHHVAHRSHDTQIKFQQAALRLSGTIVLGGRAGRMLRGQTIDPVTQSQVSWLDRICLDLRRYARQIAG